MVFIQGRRQHIRKTPNMEPSAQEQASIDLINSILEKEHEILVKRHNRTLRERKRLASHNKQGIRDFGEDSQERKRLKFQEADYLYNPNTYS